MHFWYQIEDGQVVPPRVRIAGLELDVRGEVSYALEPPSISSAGKPYRQIGNWNLKDVPYLDERWVEAVIGTPLPTCPATSRTRIRNVASYLKKVESIQGQNGSAGLVRAAAICRDNGLSEAEAMAQLAEWNHGPAVTPAWSLDELARAVTRIYAMATER